MRGWRDPVPPLTHAVAADHLTQNGIDKAAAFRNLNDKSDAGMFRKTELGDHI